MTKALGKIILILIFSIKLFANVEAKLNTLGIYEGEMASFSISAKGSDVEFPQISQIQNFAIIGNQQSQSISVINGKASKTTTKTYSFAPDKSLTIPSFEVKVDGKIYKTKELELKVLIPSASKEGDDFVLELKIDKDNLKVGESLKLSLLFKQKINSQADKIELSNPKFDNFWVKEIGDVKQYLQDDYQVQEKQYLLFAQKSGAYNIPSIAANIGVFQKQNFGNDFFNDSFFSNFNQLKWKKIYSNSLDINVSALPENLEVFGNFNINSSVDKTKVNANEPVNVTIMIQGDGNIDDIKKFNLSLRNAVVYSNDPQIQASFQNDKYGGKFTQTISIVSDRNYTIAPFIFKYFNSKENKVKTIQTKSIDIEVKSKVIQKPTIQTAQTNEAKKEVLVKQEKTYMKYLLLFFGIAIGFFSFIFYDKYKNNKNKKQSDMQKSIKKAKNDKELFDLLLPYAKEDILIATTLKKLEENLYKNSNHDINKNELIEFFEIS